MNKLRKRFSCLAAFAFAAAFGLTSQADTANFFVDTSDATLYHVANAAGLGEFRNAVNAGDTFAGKTVVLDGDITLTGNWTPIAEFAGTFNGNGHTISGLTLVEPDPLYKGNSGSEARLGLFSFINVGIVKNLTIAGAKVTSETDGALNIGVLAGKAYCGANHAGYVSNVTVSAATITSAGKYVAGIVGYDYIRIYDCKVVDSTIIGKELVGGVAGYMWCGCVEGCTATNNKIEATKSRAGGLIGRGQFSANNDPFMWVNDNVVSGEVKSPDTAGGLMGLIMCYDSGYDSDTYEIKNNYINVTFTGTTTATNPIAVLSSGQREKFCASLSKNITGNWWENETLNADSYQYTNVASGVDPQTIYRGVAKVGDTCYASLATAVEAAKAAGADTVTLLADCTVDTEVVVGKDSGTVATSILCIEGTNSVAGGYYTITVKDGGKLTWDYYSTKVNFALNANIVDQTTAGNGLYLRGYGMQNSTGLLFLLKIAGTFEYGSSGTFFGLRFDDARTFTTLNLTESYFFGPVTADLIKSANCFDTVNATTISGGYYYSTVTATTISSGTYEADSSVTVDTISGGTFKGSFTANSISGGAYYNVTDYAALLGKVVDGKALFYNNSTWNGQYYTVDDATKIYATTSRNSVTINYTDAQNAINYAEEGEVVTMVRAYWKNLTLLDAVTLIIPTDVSYTKTVNACDSQHVIKATAIEGGTQYVNAVDPEAAVAYLVHGTTTNYCVTVAGAINDAVSGDEIWLTKDCAEDLTLKVGVTVKLNNHSFTGTYTAHDYGVAVTTDDSISERYRTADDDDAIASVNLSPTLYFAKVSAAVANATDGTTIKLLKNITLTDADVQVSGGEYYVCGVIGGNGTLTFDGDSRTVTYTGSLACNFATELCNGTIKDVTFTGFKQGIVRDMKGSVAFANVKVTGTVEYDSWNWGAFADNSRAKSVTFTDCEMAVDFTAPTTPKGECHNGAFVGWTEGTQTLNFTRCRVTGNMVCGMAGMFLANISYPKPETSDLAIFTLNVTDCYNEGLLNSVYLSNLEEETPYYFNPIIGYSGEDRLSRITVNLKQGEDELVSYTDIDDLTNATLFAALKRNGGEFVNGSRTINVTPETVQEALDSAKKGDTIVLGAGAYDKLYLRQTLANSTRRTELDNGGSYPAYYRQFKDLTIKVADGANVTCKGIVAEAGLFWYSSAPASNQEAMGRATSGFLSYLELDNIVIDGIAFDTTDGNSCVVLRDNKTSENYCDILVDGLTIQNCTATGDVTNTSLHFFSAGSGTNGKCFPGTEKTALNNIAIKDCTLTNFYQPICHNNATATVNGYTITGNTFNNCKSNLIQMSNGKAAGAWVIANNTTINQDGRFARITNAAADTTFTVTNNTVTTPIAYDEDGSIFKVTGTAGYTVKDEDNSWASGTVSSDGTYISNGDTSLLPVCQIGETKYESLAAAVAAVPTAGATATTITMIADEEMDEEETVSIVNKNIVLDLNGKTISGSGDAQTKNFYLIDIGEDATVVIDDSSEDETGVITMAPTAVDTGYGKESCTIYNCGGTLTLKAGKVVNGATAGLAYAINNSSNAWGIPVYSTFNMEGGTVSAPKGDGALRVYINAGQQISENYVNISGGTILDTGIFVDSVSYQALSDNMVCVINVTGGTVNGLIDLKLRNEAVTMNISGGTFGDSRLRVRNYTSESLITKLTEPAINISGGTFTFQSAETAFVALDWATDSANPFKVSGGTYSVEPPAAYVVDGYQVNKVTVDETDCWVVGEIVETGDDTTAVVIIDEQTASADVTEKPKTMTEEVAEKVVQNTQVTGVKLVASNETHAVSGAQSVVSVAKETGSDEFKSNIEKGTNVVIQVDVEVKPTVYVAPTTGETKEGEIKFNLQPVATVTIDEGGENKTNKVDVTNEMLDLLQNIYVTVYTGFKPVLAVHADKNGETIETFDSDHIQYDEATGNATIIISHFSDVTFFEASNDAVVTNCADKDGAEKSVTIPQAWLLDNNLTAEDATSKTNTVNGLPVWKSYVLGQDPAATVAYNALKVLPQDDGTVDVEIYGFDADGVQTDLVTVSYACSADTEVNGSFATKLESSTTTFEEVQDVGGKRFFKNATVDFTWK